MHAYSKYSHEMLNFGVFIVEIFEIFQTFDVLAVQILKSEIICDLKITNRVNNCGSNITV